MDAFSILDREVNLLRYSPLCLSQCNISHLLFVDDILMVSHPNSSTVHSLNYALDCLDSYMEIKINYDKSVVMWCGELQLLQFS